MVMLSTEYVVALVTGLGTLFTGLGAVLGVVLKNWSDARVKIIKAEADAAKDERLAELKAEKACTDELKREIQEMKESHQREMSEIKQAHQECLKQHAGCEQSLAGLRGYVEGKFEVLEKNVQRITSSTTQIPVSVHVVDQPKIEVPAAPAAPAT